MPALLTLAALLSLWQPAQTPVRPQAPTAAGTSTLRGVVINAKTAAPVADARVLLVEAARTMQTTADGRFEFPNLAAGKHTISVSIIGYIYVRRQVEIARDAALDLTLPLAEGTGTYQETITVTAAITQPAELGVSSQQELGSAALQDLRGVIADDPMRAIQALPGVATGDDLQAEFSVRGSAFRHVGIVLDGTATPLLLHSVRGTNDSGSVAMINSDILERAGLFAGPHPQRHGDWIGATLEFDVREGSRDRAQVRIAVSGTSASSVLEGPIGTAKRGSWLVSIRKSYIDWLVRKLLPEIDSTIGFKDLQSKFAYNLTGRQHVTFTMVGGSAVYNQVQTSIANGLADATSRGTLASAAWRYTRNTWFLTQRAAFVASDFHNRGLQGQELASANTHSIVWRGDATWFPAKSLTIEVGAKSDAQREALTLKDYATLSGNRIQLRAQTSSVERTTLASGWGQIVHRRARGGVAFGARVTADSMSSRTVASPWLLAEWRLGPLTFRGGVGAAHQFPELELRPNTTGRLPERAVSADLGVEHRLTSTLRWQLTAFNRQDTDVVRRLGEPRIVNGVRVAEATFPSFASTLGGRTRGVDLTVSRRGAAGLTGWVAYSYAHTHYRDRLGGEEFDGDFDQRHTLNVFLEQRLSYRAAISAKLRVGSNFPIVGYFRGTPDALFLAPDRNRVRLPVYARLDLRANRTFTFDRRRVTLFAEVMNALGRSNLGQFDGFIRTSTLEAVGYITRMIPRIPSVGILIEF